MSTPSPPPDPEEPLSDDDAAWQAIVANYGERAEVDEQLSSGTETGPPAPGNVDAGRDDHATPAPTPVPVPVPAPEDRFVPPAPPPLPKPPPARLLAWIGLFGVPFFVLVALVAQVPMPSWLGLVMMAWFAGGFVYLVVSMGPGPGDGHDDGARL